MRQLACLLLKTPTDRFFIPLTLVRIALGSFFFASGFNKLFVPENQAAMSETMMDAGVPFPVFMAIFVATCEALSGFLLIFGILSRLNAMVLLVISLVALFSVGLYSTGVIAALVGQRPFLLVTSANHLPRAMRFFTTQGLHPIPAPANQLVITTPLSLRQRVLPNTAALQHSQLMWYETLGSIWQRLTASREQTTAPEYSNTPVHHVSKG